MGLCLTHIKKDLLTKHLNFSITSKTLTYKDMNATIEDAVKDLEKKKEADTICAKIGFAFPNSKTPRDKLSKNEYKA